MQLPCQVMTKIKNGFQCWYCILSSWFTNCFPVTRCRWLCWTCAEKRWYKSFGEISSKRGSKLQKQRTRAGVTLSTASSPWRPCQWWACSSLPRPQEVPGRKEGITIQCSLICCNLWKTSANLALQHFLQDLLLSLSKLLGQRLHSRVNIGKSNFWEQQNILLVNTLLPARLHLFWQVPPPSKEQGRNCCLCCQPLSPAQGKDVLSFGGKCEQDVQWTLFTFLHSAEIVSVWGKTM